VPSADSIVPSRARVPSAGKMTEASQDLERFLFGLQQGRCVSPDPEQCVSPLRAGRALRVKSKRRGVEEDPLAPNSFDHGPLGEDLLEGLAAGQPSVIELKSPQLRQRVIIVLQCGLDPVLGAQVAHEDGDDQRVGLIAGHLDEARGGRIRDVLVLEVAEVLHLEQAAGTGARHPRWLAAP